METPADPGYVPRGSGKWTAIALGLLTAGWVAYFLIERYSLRLAEKWGPAPDVVDALGRDAYISRHTLPWYTAMLVLDALAVAVLFTPSRPGWPRVIKVVVALLLVPTALLHGLAWLGAGLFAG